MIFTVCGYSSGGSIESNEDIHWLWKTHFSSTLITIWWVVTIFFAVPPRGSVCIAIGIQDWKEIPVDINIHSGQFTKKSETVQRVRIFVSTRLVEIVLARHRFNSKEFLDIFKNVLWMLKHRNDLQWEKHRIKNLVELRIQTIKSLKNPKP